MIAMRLVLFRLSCKMDVFKYVWQNVHPTFLLRVSFTSTKEATFTLQHVPEEHT